MEYISAKEAADIWHISSRSVTRFASSGKISGAIKVGKNWMIPRAAFIPRKKESPAETESPISPPSKENSPTLYHFPVYYFTKYYLKRDELSDIEQKLYDAQIFYLTSRSKEAYILLYEILNLPTSQCPVHVRIGALYTLCNLACHTSNLSIFLNAAKELDEIFKTDFPNKTELSLLHTFIKGYYEGFNAYSIFSPLSIGEYTNAAFPFAFWIYIINYCHSFITNGASTDITLFELIYNNIYQTGLFYVIQFIDVHLIYIYQATGHMELARKHTDNAFRIAREHQSYIPLVIGFLYLGRTFEQKLKLESKEMQRTVTQMQKDFRNGWYMITAAYTGRMPLMQLTFSEMELAFYITSGLSSKEIAKMQNVSTAHVNKTLSVIYEKTFTNKRSELKEYLCNLFAPNTHKKKDI